MLIPEVSLKLTIQSLTSFTGTYKLLTYKLKIVYIAHWVIFCLQQTLHIFFVCAPRGFLSDMIYCNEMFLFMPVQAASLHGGFQSKNGIYQ